MESIVTALLSADFPKVAGIIGFVFLFLGIVDSKLVLGPVVIPRRDTVGRVASLGLGFLFACVPLIQVFFGGTLAVYSPPTRNAVTVETKSTDAGQGILDFSIGSANAAEKRYKITVGQRSVIDVSKIFGGKMIAVYVGDIHLTRPNTILFFDKSAPGAARISTGVSLKEGDIRNILPPADIILLASLTQGRTQRFVVDQQRYTLTVDTVIWSIIGADSVILSVTSEIP